MKVLFISNYYTHHQAPLCEALDLLTKHQFTFVETEEFPQERKDLGWEEQNGAPFVKQYVNVKHRESNTVVDADIVILGNAPLQVIRPRLKAKKLTFLYSERIYKNGYQPIKWLPRLLTFWWRYGRFESLYLLSASAYASFDYAVHGAFCARSYKWGYFPKTKHYNINELFENKNASRIMWCGRFLDWKHPEMALEIAKRLRNTGHVFEMVFIGAGAMKNEIERLAKNAGLTDSVIFLDAMNSEEVRHYMEQAGIYLFTSDFHEGWGAVLNEAMNSGCAVVASHAIGAVPFLLKHEENGLIYHNGNVEELYEYVEKLLDNPELQKRLGSSAYLTINQTWNAEIAAERFLNLAEQIKSGGCCDLYSNGPCSPANAVRNDWY